ncbi:MAG: DegT/DnrJ/EryC1/StrS family aminotransferase [Spirochaetota bacterium]|nr:DegT/DnrJ/EryC1/StrS family aminotransferase [Spirochaetota bacterium]
MDFIDLNAQQVRIKKRIDENIAKVLAHGQYINGPEVKELEEKLSEYVNVPYAVGCSNGTVALLISLMAYNIGPGDAVFTTPFTFIATAEVIQLLGATPVFVDIYEKTYNIDVAKLETAVKKVINDNIYTPRGIISVDLFGQPADYQKINALAKDYNLFVLEDAAQSFGATYHGQKACSLAETSATSFYPAKPLGCYGEGGMVFTHSKELYDTLVSIRDHGQGNEKYHNVRIGINGRLDTLQAAILLAKFEIFDDELNLRKNAAKRYDEALRDVVDIPFIKQNISSSWSVYSIMHTKRDSMIKQLKDEGIPTAIYYPIPLHLQKAFSHLGYCNDDFPVSEIVSNNILSIPIHPYLSKEEQDKVIAAITNFS